MKISIKLTQKSSGLFILWERNESLNDYGLYIFMESHVNQSQSITSLHYTADALKKCSKA